MKKTALVLMGLIIGFSAAELFLRFQAEIKNSKENAKTEIDETKSIYQYDSLLGWRMKASSSARQKNSEFDIVYEINGQGFRDGKDYLMEKSGEKRLAVFGDSFTFGVGVKNENVFSKILERNSSYEVLNFGVSGYDVGQYLLSLKENGLKYDPDAVVFAVYTGNDVEDAILEHPFQSPRFKPYFKLENGNLVLKNNPVPLEENSKTEQSERVDYRVKNVSFYNKIKWLLEFKTVLLGKNLIKQNFYPFLSRLGLVKSLADYEENFSVIREILKESRDILGEKEFIVMIIPSKNIKYNYLEKEFGRKLEEISSELGISSVNLTSDLMKEGNCYFPQEGHFNEKGHEVAEKLLQEAIVNQ